MAVTFKTLWRENERRNRWTFCFMLFLAGLNLGFAVTFGSWFNWFVVLLCLASGWYSLYGGHSTWLTWRRVDALRGSTDKILADIRARTGAAYYSRDGLPISFDTWALEYEHIDRHVARTRFYGRTVSTVYLGLDHQFGIGPPLIFESMAFHDITGFEDHDCERYTTVEQARAGHKAMVRRQLHRGRHRAAAIVAGGSVLAGLSLIGALT